MLIDKISMITLLIIYIILALISLFTYLIIVGGSMNKTDEEIIYENDAQTNYLKEKQIEKQNRRKKFGHRNK